MKGKDLHRAERLLDAIGDVDDRFLAEAAGYRSRRASILRFPMRSVAVAAVAALLLLAVTSPALQWLKSIGEKETPPAVVPVAPTLGSLLSDCAESSAFTLSSAEEIDFFDGAVRLTVEDRATGELFVSQPLTKAQQATLSREFSAAGKRVNAAEAPSEWRVWVLLGDGTVATPCLDPSAGTVGCGVLFDYEDERIPTDRFLNLLEELTSGKE